MAKPTNLCCSVLQCVAVHCSALQCVAVCYSVLQCVAVCCSALQRVAACCSVLCYQWRAGRPFSNPWSQLNVTQKRSIQPTLQNFGQLALISMVMSAFTKKCVEHFLKKQKNAFTSLLEEIVFGDLNFGDLPKVKSPLSKCAVDPATHCNTLQHTATHH